MPLPKIPRNLPDHIKAILESDEIGNAVLAQAKDFSPEDMDTLERALDSLTLRTRKERTRLARENRKQRIALLALAVHNVLGGDDAVEFLRMMNKRSHKQPEPPGALEYLRGMFLGVALAQSSGLAGLAKNDR